MKDDEIKTDFVFCLKSFLTTSVLLTCSRNYMARMHELDKSAKVPCQPIPNSLPFVITKGQNKRSIKNDGKQLKRKFIELHRE